MRTTRDLLRRHNYFMHKRADLLAHIQNTNSQYNLPEFGKKLSHKTNREGVAERFQARDVQRTIEIDLELIDHYTRLVKCTRESAGKRHGTSGKKIGNAHLKWAFSEAVVLFLRGNPNGMRYKKRLEKKHGKPKALTILAHKLGRATYYMLKREQAFDMAKFLAA